MFLNCGVGEDSWESLHSSLLADCKEIKPVNPKGNQSWIFIGRTDAEAETPILWPPDVKNWLIGKDPDAGKDWGQEENGTTEDEMVGWHHWLNGLEFEQALGVGEVHRVAKGWTQLSDWTDIRSAIQQTLWYIIQWLSQTHYRVYDFLLPLKKLRLRKFPERNKN